jgi:hypothetical protein
MVSAADKQVVRKENAVIGSKPRRDDMSKTRSTALHKSEHKHQGSEDRSPAFARAMAWQAEISVAARP